MGKLICLRVLLGALLLGIALCDVAAITGSISPTGGINMTSKLYTLDLDVEILDQHFYVTTFDIYIFFPYSGFFGITTGFYPQSKIIVTHPSGLQDVHNNKILAQDRPTDSAAAVLFGISLEKGCKVGLSLGDIQFVDLSKAKEMRVIVALTSQGTTLLEKRVTLPFHPYSYVATSKYKDMIFTNFTSSLGFINSSYVNFTYPSCMSLSPTDGLVNCSSLAWFVAKSDSQSVWGCYAAFQELIILDLGMEFPESKEEDISFVVMPIETTCGADDVVYVTVHEAVEGKVIEQAALFGFDKEYTDKNKETSNAEIGLAPMAILIYLLFILF